MPYYNICDLCGATLDPGEKCTCVEDARKEKESEKLKKMVEFTKTLIQNSKSKRRKSK